jgi:segregation and condensation protein A
MIPMLETPGSEALRVELSAFTGPLDLLLHLIKEQEMDIYEIRLEKLTEQYLARLDKMREENLAVAGEFLVMAATLIYLKSRTLLPVQDRPPEEVEDEDPKWELIRQLIEYRKFKEAAGQLGDREALHSRIFGRIPERVVVNQAMQGPGQVSMFDLVWAFQKVLRSLEDRSKVGRFEDEQFTVGQKIEFILDRVLPGEEVLFEEHVFPRRGGGYLFGHVRVDSASSGCGSTRGALEVDPNSKNPRGYFGGSNGKPSHRGRNWSTEWRFRSLKDTNYGMGTSTGSTLICGNGADGAFASGHDFARWAGGGSRLA